MGHCWVYILLCCILLYYINGKLEEGVCSTSQSRKYHQELPLCLFINSPKISLGKKANHSSVTVLIDRQSRVF